MNPTSQIDYLVIGHLTQDLVPGAAVLGGTAAYSAKTALSLGLNVAIITIGHFPDPIKELEGIQLMIHQSEVSSTFENINTPGGRIQYIHHVAPQITPEHIPDAWRNPKIVHLGPIANEVRPDLVNIFPNSFIGLTPQGWMRTWDDRKRIHSKHWDDASTMLPKADAAVLSVEDVENDESKIDEMIELSRTLVVTESYSGARVYHQGEFRYFHAPEKCQVDPTGAGDIFATCFFSLFHQYGDPWQAAEFATEIAASSVTRPGLLAPPSVDDITQVLLEMVPNSR